MPAIHFDITGDNSNIVSTVNDTVAKFEDLAETVRNSGVKSFSELGKIIKDNDEYIAQETEKLNDMAKAFQEAAQAGDLDKMASLGSQMKEQAENIQGVINETNEYKNALEGLNEKAEENVGIMAKMLGGQEKYNAIISQLPGPLRSAVSGLNGMVGAARAFIATPLGAVLAALILAYKSITTWLHKSAEGQQALARISGYLQGLLAGLQQVVMDVGKALYNAFTNPKQAISQLWQSLKNDLLGRIQAAGGVFVNFGKIIGNAFKGDFKEAGEAAKAMADDFQKVFTGKDVSELKEGAKAIADRAKGIGDIAKAQSELSARENKLHRDRTAWLNEEAELDKQIAEERNKLRIGSQSERAAAAARMQELINKRTAREVELAKEEYEIKKASNALTDSSQEDLDEEERLRARVVQLETQGITQKGFALRVQDSMNRSIAKMNKSLEDTETIEESIGRRLKDIYSSIQNISMAQAFENMMSAEPMLRKYLNEPIEEEVVDEKSVAEEIAEHLDKVRKRAESITDAFMDMGDALEDVGGVAGELGYAFNQIGKSALKVIDIWRKAKDGGEFDMASSVSSLVSGVVQLGAMVGAQIKENKEAQKEWNAVIADSVHEFTMLKLEALDYKQNNIFGVENPYKKAIDGAIQYREAIARLNEQTAKLAGGKVQTGTKKAINWANVGKGAGIGATAGAVAGAGIFSGLTAAAGAAIGAGVGLITGLLSTKVVPVFENLTDKYGTIVNEDFSLNPQLLADYDKLDDETKKLVDNWEDIKAKAEEAEQQMRDTFTSLSGDIGGQLSDSLVEAFRNGRLDSAIDSFHGKMTGTIEDIVEQMVFANIFSDMFDELQKDMESSFGANGDNNIVDDLMRFEEAYQSGLEEYGEQMEAAREYLQSKGYDAWGGSSNVEASSRGFAAMSQDTGNELNGRFAAIQISNQTIAQGVTTGLATLLTMQSLMVSGGSALSDIRDMHILETGYLADIAKQTKPIPSMVEAIDKIERNTSRL